MTPNAPLSEPEKYWVPVESIYDESEQFMLPPGQRDVEVVLASDYRALASQIQELKKAYKSASARAEEYRQERLDSAREWEQRLADAQARVKALEGLMHRATVQHVTAERIAEIRHVLGTCSLDADATPTLADELDAYARQLEQQLKELEQQRIEYGPICLNCGASKPCMTEEEANKHGGSIPCTFDPAPRELWDRCKRLEQQNAALREALECTLYALENPNSDYLFAINAAKQALATGEETGGQR